MESLFVSSIDIKSLDILYFYPRGIFYWTTLKITDVVTEYENVSVFDMYSHQKHKDHNYADWNGFTSS